jgi:hypothetical protein
MARFTSVDRTRSVGFDEERGLLIMQAGKKAELYLVAGENLNVYAEDPDLVSVTSKDKDVAAAHRSTEVTSGEQGQTVRLVTLKAGAREGTTELRAGSGGIGWAGPLEIQVVQNAERRQVGRGIGEATGEIREELLGLSLRDAVIRVAEDQMYSNVCLGNGFGTYMASEIIKGTPADWCGGFAHWCWRQAAAIKNVENPFGDDGSVLWSPQRAIGWAMRNPDKAVVFRYKGGDPGPHPVAGTQEWHDIGWNGYSLERADIVLVRKLPDKGDAWRHVTQIDSVGESVIHTIDGNQGNGRCIKRRTYNINKKLTNGQFELAFLHVLI